MANGAAPYLLKDISQIAKEATPQFKIDAHGLAGMVLTTSDPSAINITSEPSGHKNTVNFWYRKPFTVAQTDTALSCDQQQTSARIEGTTSVGNVRQLAIHIDDETIATYTSDASNRQATGGTPSSTVYAEMMNMIMGGCNALYKGVNTDLWGLTSFGRNRVSNSTAATTVNIEKNGDVRALGTGLTKLLRDAQKNNLSGRPQIVGEGLLWDYLMESQTGQTTANQNGIDARLQMSGMDFWRDIDAATAAFSSDANAVGLFEPNSIQFIQYKKYTGFKAGVFPTSTFGTFSLPLVNDIGRAVRPMTFDYQLKYYDCAQTITEAYSGASYTVEKGWSIIISINFGLWQIPADAYRNDDDRIAINGALKYTFTNTCSTCS